MSTIVGLNKQDVDRICSLQDGKFDDGWNRQMLVSAFEDGRFYAFGVQDDNNLYGYVGITLSLDFADVESVFIDNQARRKGFAMALMRTALDFIEQHGIKRVLLEVKDKNVPAIALYEKLGFKKISTRKKYYRDGADAIIMQREI